MKQYFGLAAGLLLLGMGGWGQSSAPAASPAFKLPEYDIVSVREDKDAVGDSFNGTPSGVQISASLVELLKEAYGLFYLNDDQVIGLPSWAKSKHFDLDAKVAAEDVAAYRKLTRLQRGEMLQPVLEERFELKARPVVNEGPVYDLVIARHGAKLSVTNLELTGPAGSHVSGCKSGCWSSRNGHLEAKGVELSTLAGFLTRETQRTVVDQTGLKGKYDLVMDWTPLRGDGNDSAAQPGTPPELFTALEEQLGLKLQAGKGLVESIVVDHIEEPSAN